MVQRMVFFKKSFLPSKRHHVGELPISSLEAIDDPVFVFLDLGQVAVKLMDLGVIVVVVVVGLNLVLAVCNALEVAVDNSVLVRKGL